MVVKRFSSRLVNLTLCSLKERGRLLGVLFGIVPPHRELVGDFVQELVAIVQFAGREKVDGRGMFEAPSLDDVVLHFLDRHCDVLLAFDGLIIYPSGSFVNDFFMN